MFCPHIISSSLYKTFQVNKSNLRHYRAKLFTWHRRLYYKQLVQSIRQYKKQKIRKHPALKFATGFFLFMFWNRSVSNQRTTNGFRHSQIQLNSFWCNNFKRIILLADFQERQQRNQQTLHLSKYFLLIPGECINCYMFYIV
jgi:hypothetical protein